LGHDVLTSQDAGNAGLAVADSEVFQFAIAEQRAIITLNRRHFVALHQRDSVHAGIIVCTFDTDFAGLAARIHTALIPHPDIHGKLIRVNREGSPRRM
jgi:hypothetical protein